MKIYLHWKFCHGFPVISKLIVNTHTSINKLHLTQISLSARMTSCWFVLNQTNFPLPPFLLPCSFHHHFIFVQRHAFIHPARALVKVMSMTTGELDYDDIFHHREGEEEIPFPLISFPLWIIFLVMMPVLLNNYLVRRTFN